MSIERLYDFTPDDFIVSSQVDEELNQLVIAVNAAATKDGTLQSNLNADLLDGFHASETGGADTIPVCNGDMQVGLNAEMIGGLTSSDLAEAGFPAGTRMVFAQASPPAGWSEVSRPNVDRVLTWGKTAAGGANNSETAWSNLGTYYSVEVAEHVLTVNEIPAHTHAYTLHTFNANGAQAGTGIGGILGSTGGLTGLSGGGQGHSHTGGLNSGAQPAANYRPPIHWIIVASKDA